MLRQQLKTIGSFSERFFSENGSHSVRRQKQKTKTKKGGRTVRIRHILAIFFTKYTLDKKFEKKLKFDEMFQEKGHSVKNCHKLVVNY